MRTRAPGALTKSLAPHKSMSPKGLPPHDHQLWGAQDGVLAPGTRVPLGVGQSTAREDPAGPRNRRIGT